MSLHHGVNAPSHSHSAAFGCRGSGEHSMNLGKLTLFAILWVMVSYRVASLGWEMGQLRLRGLSLKVLRSPGPTQPHSSPPYAKSHCLGQILNPLSTET